jgi:hypothetical protein
VVETNSMDVSASVLQGRRRGPVRGRQRSPGAVKRRIAELNQTIASVCAEFADCGSDGKATYKLWSSLTSADLAFDYSHLSLAGQARLAATWAVTPYPASSTSTGP